MLNRRDKQLLEHYFPNAIEHNFTEDQLKRFLVGMPRVYHKKRSIEKLHSLWMLADARATKRHSDRYNFIMNFIIKDIPCNGNREYTLYHDQGENGLYKYTVEWDSTIKSYSSNYSRINSSTRQGKLTPMLATSKAYEYGAKFRYLDHELATDYQRKVFTQMWDKIKERLKDYYASEKRPYVEEVITVEISGHQYHVSAANHYSGYMEFTWEGKVNNIIINLDDEK